MVHLDLLVGKRLAENASDQPVKIKRMKLVVGRGAPRVNLEAREVPGLPQSPHGRSTVLVLIESAEIRKGNARHAGHARNGVRQLWSGATALDRDKNVTGDALNLPDGKVPQCTTQICHELIFKG